MKIINIILPEWKIWTSGSLPEIRPSIVRMRDVAIQTQPEVDLPSKLALDGLSYFDYHISTQFDFNCRPNALPIFGYYKMDS